jgi:catechol 2,3-dioxygenase-like lactoylglutathione lyase family enzyme
MMSHFHGLAACFPVADVGATARWYRDVLGFRFNTFPDTEPFKWASMFDGRTEIMLQEVPGYEKPDLDPRRPGGVWSAYLYVTGVDALYERIREKVTVRRTPCDQPYRMREFEIADPNGYVLVFGEDLTGPPAP